MTTVPQSATVVVVASHARRPRQLPLWSISPKGVFPFTLWLQAVILTSCCRTYLVSAPLILYYNTALVGDAKVLPTLKASAGFSGIAVIDADPYIDGGNGTLVFSRIVSFHSVFSLLVSLVQVPSGMSTK